MSSWLVPSSFNCIDWFLLPPATDALIDLVSRVTKGRFIGDPSHVYEQLEIHRQGEGEGAVEEEVVVSMINTACIKVNMKGCRIRFKTKSHGHTCHLSVQYCKTRQSV